MVKSRISKVRKRDGSIVNFDINKISNAIRKATLSMNIEYDISKAITCKVELILFEKFKGNIPKVEDIQNIIEEVLSSSGYPTVAKAYIIYREKRKELRDEKSEYFHIKDNLKLSLNALKILHKRYLMKDEKGKVIESPSQMFRRVAHAVALVELKYNQNYKDLEEKFFDIMSSLKFLPNSPCLMNAGTSNQQLSACFVLPIEDSLDKIYETLKTSALIQKTGGGTGFSFSKLRPAGDFISSTTGVTSGPVSFMSLFDKSTGIIKMGSRRRGANMGILNVNHPDIIDFITCKDHTENFSNFNISVAVTDNFMDAVIKNKNYELVNPRNKKIVAKIDARDIFELIITQAWKTGDPGMIFIDKINKYHTLNENIEATNPCGEQPLLSNESCVLGSINLSKFADKRGINWNDLKDTIQISVQFLDNIIDANNYVTKEIEEITKSNRKIGLGIMGWAEMLAILGIPYTSKNALTLAEKLMKFINNEARKKSYELGLKRGSFPNLINSKLKKHFRHMRNATVTTIAPTGTLSLIANCSSGIEPFFAISFVRNVMEGTRLIETNSVFERIAHEKKFYSKELMFAISETGSVQKLHSVPDNIKKLFLNALEINYETQIKMQASFQKYVDNAVSKTINLRNDSKISDVKKAYLLAYKLGCKGITVFRYGSKENQVLTMGTDSHIIADSEFSGGCTNSECTY